MREEVLNELVPTLQRATDEQLKIIGIGAFGGNCHLWIKGFYQNSRIH